MENMIEIEWNSENGCKMKQFPEGNYGISSFQVINENKLAVLCDMEHKVKIYDLVTKKLSYEFSYDKMSFCYLLTYSNKLETFYLYNNYKILSFSKNGTFLKNIEISKAIVNEGIVQLQTIDNNLYAICIYKSTYTLIENGVTLSAGQQETSKIDGVYDTKGNIIKIQKNSKFNFEISSSEKSSEKYPISLNSDFNDNDLKYIGSYNDCFAFILYSLVTFNPINIKGQIIFYSKNEKKIINTIEIPSYYYTRQYNDVQIYNNSIYQFFSTPEHAVLLKNEFNENESIDFIYPEDYRLGVDYNLLNK